MKTQDIKVGDTLEVVADLRTAAPPQAQHSPLPWKVEQTSEATLDIVYSDGEIRSRIAQLNVYTLADEHSNGGIEANAKFIVRACNNAQRLADALKDCETSPGALAERSHEYALRRLATITETAREALAEWSKSI